MIDSLCDQTGEQSATVTCFYFDFAVQKGQSPTSTMGALLKQVVGGLEVIPEEVSRAYQKQRKALGGRGPRLSDLVKMLQATSSKERTFICIDALDECVPGNRVKLLGSLNKILQNSPSTRIFLTGRPHIKPEIRRRFSGRVTNLSISTKRDDIIRYLRSRLEEDTTPDAMDSILKAEILKNIPESLSEMYVQIQPPGSYLKHALIDESRFLLVSLNIDAVLQETTIHRRRQKLRTMAGGLGLGDAYGATLDRIKGQGGEKAQLGVTALMWISHAERPLKADELCHALAVEIGSPDFNIDNVPSIATLLACCQGLVVVEKESSIVRLVHFTLQEYLRSHPDLFGPIHSTMAETCLTYLNSQQIKALSANLSSSFQHTLFLEYSSLYWGMHAKRDLSDHAKQLALGLFGDRGHRVSAVILLQAQKSYWNGVDFDKPSPFGGLHCASLFGIVEIVNCLIEMEGSDINQMDFTGNTPLHWAAQNGHEGVVRALLGRGGVSPDEPDGSGQIPLHHAAGRGYEGVVRILLGRGGGSPDKPDNNGRTPLWWAASNGREGVVKMLLELDSVNPDKPDNSGQTPLNWAAWSGHEEVVKILLGRGDVNPDRPDDNGQTPLWWAACNGHEGVVKVLLERGDVNADKPDNDGKTPLQRAVSKGHEEVVKILLRRDDVNPDRQDSLGRTPLFNAAGCGYEGVVKILLGREFNHDKPDNWCQTPLWWAAYNGREGVVKILLGRDHANPDTPDRWGQTPLFIAACCGHEGVVKILLQRDDVSPDKPNINGRTALYRAAWNGHEGVVKMLLGGDDVNPNKLDKDGRTPFDRATENGHKGVIALLPHPEHATPSLS